MATEKFGLFPDREGVPVPSTFRDLDGLVWGRLGRPGDWKIPENILESRDDPPFRNMGDWVRRILEEGSASKGFHSLYHVKWHHASLPHVPFLAVPKIGSEIWFQKAEESSKELFRNTRGNWVLEENFEKPITLQLHRLARARTAIQGHAQFHGNRSDGVEFITARLQEAHATKEALVKTMLEAKIAANFWAALICWWMVVYPDWVRMGNSLSQILDDVWATLQDCEWVGVVVDLTRDKLTAPFAMMALNHVPFYYPWTLGAARDASLARLSPVLVSAFDRFYSSYGRHGTWEDLEEEERRCFPSAANYDLLLQDSNIRADLPSSLNEIPRNGKILIIPSAGWEGYFLEGPRKFNIGKELVRSRAHRLDHLDNQPVVVIYLSFARRDSNITLNELYGIRDLLRYRRGPAWGEIFSVRTGVLERPGFTGLDRGIIPLAVSESRQPVSREVSLLGAIGGKGATRPTIDVDREVENETADKGKGVRGRKRERIPDHDEDLQRRREESYERYLSAGEESFRRNSSRSVSRGRSISSNGSHYRRSSSGSQDSERSEESFIRESRGGGRFITQGGWIRDESDDNESQDPLLARMTDNPTVSLQSRIAPVSQAVAGPSHLPVAERINKLVVPGAGPTFEIVTQPGPMLPGMPKVVANNLANLAAKILLPSVYRARNPGILSFDRRVIDHGYLVVDDVQTCIILKLLANVQPRVQSAEDLLVEAVRRGVPVRIAYHEDDISLFRPGSRDLQRIEKDKVYYEAGYEEPRLEFKSGGKKLLNQLTSFANLALSRPNAQSFFSEGGTSAWVAWREGSDELKSKIFKGPSMQSFEYRKGEKLFEGHLEVDEITESHRGLLLGHLPGENTEDERWVFPPEPWVKELLSRQNRYHGGQMSPFLDSKLKKIAEEVKGGGARTRTRGQFRTFFKFSSGTDRFEDVYRPTKEDFDYAQRVLMMCYPKSWDGVKLSELRLPERYEGL
ncbi:hypothetical protein C8J56DRAFT_912531 [Mycena floridula]|nr:hypothetical protein C8J56DRAFT_936557 [Mycena floridula]KAJ7601233.1 hypothetical protein C8J56DRAFT_912531 [Mycena floridula]